MKKVMIIEDDPAILDILGILFTRASANISGTRLPPGTCLLLDYLPRRICKSRPKKPAPMRSWKNLFQTMTCYRWPHRSSVAANYQMRR